MASISKLECTLCIKNTLRHMQCRSELPVNYAAHKRLCCSVPSRATLRTALFFAGHGVQRVGMLSSWVNNFPDIARSLLSEMDSVLGYRLSRIILEGPNAELSKTENSQPAIMATSMLILRILEEKFGFDTKSRVDVTLGHSLGEFSALVAGGYLNFGDALRIVRRRAEIMAHCTREASKESGEDYGMVALVCEPERLDGLLIAIHKFPGFASFGLRDDSTHGTLPSEQVMVANINSRNQIVLSGSIARIRTLLIQLRQFSGHDPRPVRLNSESPFHSTIMAPVADYMIYALNNVKINFPAHMPCISNVSGLPFSSEQELKALLSRQCVDTVRLWDSIRYLDQERGVKRWIGIGPGKVGRNLVGKEVGRDMVRGAGVWAVCDPCDLEIIMNSLEQTENEVKSH